MNKAIKSIALVLAIAATGTATAQNAYESSVKINKTTENAVVADFNKPADVVEAALKDRLEKEGLGKMKSSKGFMTYAGTLWNSVSSDKLDVYFKVEGKKDKSTVSVLVSKGYNNFVTSGSDAKIVSNVKAFLNDFSAYTNSYELSLNIKAQEEIMKKAEKAFNNSTDNNKDLLSQKEKLERKIVESNNEQILKQKALDEEKRKLEDLKARINK
jgi:glycerol dehydrogenase-like iron-containing ADH family enzyme